MTSLLDLKKYFSERAQGSLEDAAKNLNEDINLIRSAADILVEKGVIEEVRASKCSGCAVESCEPSCLTMPKVYRRRVN